MAEIAAMRAKAELEAIEIKVSVERDAKDQTDRTASAMRAKAELEIAEMKAKAGQELQQQRNVN